MNTAQTETPQKTVDETFPASENESIAINNYTGSVTINGWNKNEINVTGLMGQRQQLKVKRSGTATSITVKYPQKLRAVDPNGRPATLTINVPTGSILNISTHTAPITVNGIQNQAVLESVSGNIVIKKSPAKQIDVSSVGGDLMIDGSPNSLSVASVGGNITVTEAQKNIALTVTSGILTVNGKNFEQIAIKGTSVKITIEGNLAPNAVAAIETTSGNLQLKLPANTSARFTLKTLTGTITSDFSDVSGKNMAFETGDGSAQVNVTTLEGNISILKK